MLSKEDMDLLCRVGPGTPMGHLMRQYWLPLVYTWELESDGPPLRVRILGENLIAWRDSEGKPGFIAENCPHRGASLFFGRNEEIGLRCVYHGWKFDTAGRCLDMPNEPPESNFKDKIKATAYRGADRGGVTWVYMGPRQQDPPGLPDWEWCLVPEEQVHHQHKVIYQCNWAQALEGELDTTHVYFLHSRLNTADPGSYGLYVPDKAARLEILETDYGVLYGARREEDADSYYWRTTQFLFPIYGMFPGGGEDGTVPLSIYLPVDDEHTLHWGLRWHPSMPLAGDRRPVQLGLRPTGELIAGVGPMKPEQKGRFFAHWWPAVSPDNDYMQDRTIQKTRNFTGIGSVRLQDSAVIQSMGRIMDRTKEHLGTADAALIRVRRRLINAARALGEQGTMPPGVDEPELYRVRSCMAVLPKGRQWQEAMDAWLHARTVEHPTGGFSSVRAFDEGRVRRPGALA